jgi:hypothetical protein
MAREINTTLKDKINKLCFYYPYISEFMQREGMISKANAETLVNWRIEQKRKQIENWFLDLPYEQKNAFAPYFVHIENILTKKQ